MVIRLGYAGMPITIQNFTYSKTLNYSTYQKLDPTLAKEKIHQVIKTNLENFKQVLLYNKQNEIYFYRFSHHLIPLATHPLVDIDYIHPYRQKWKEIGNMIKNNSFRVDTHPDQYCVLNSEKFEVVEMSIRLLKYQLTLYQAMEIQGKIILHIGSGTPNKEDALARFEKYYQTLDEKIKKMILLENDDKVFTVLDTLLLCERLHIPMVLDYLHYQCNHGKEKLTDYLPRIFATWKNTGLNPKIHFSNSKSRKQKRSHSDKIDFNSFEQLMKMLAPFNQDIDVMLECKHKDEALLSLVRQIRLFTNYSWINGSSFIV